MVDGRCRVARVIRDFAKELERHVGGNPTPAQQVLIREAALKNAKLAMLADQILDSTAPTTTGDPDLPRLEQQPAPRPRGARVEGAGAEGAAAGRLPVGEEGARRVNYLEALDHPDLFGPWFAGPSWKAWRMVERAIFGLPIPEEDLPLFKELTGRDEPPDRPVKEAWIIAGRRSAKSRKAATIGTYLATIGAEVCGLARHPGAGRARGGVDHGDRPEAGAGDARVRGGVVPGDPGAAGDGRARDGRGARADQPHGADGAAERLPGDPGPDAGGVHHGRDQLLAERADGEPGRRGVPGGEAGVGDDAGEPDDRDQQPVPAGWAAVAEVQAALGPGGRRAGGEGADAGAEPADRRAGDRGGGGGRPGGGAGGVGRGVPERHLGTSCGGRWWRRWWLPGVYERPPVGAHRGRYVAFTDPSGGSSDSFTVAVAHQEDGVAVVDCVRERRPPFSPEAVVGEYAALLKQYGVHQVRGDRYAGEWPREQYMKRGVHYWPSDKTKSEIYLECLPLLNGRRVELLDDDRLVEQICGLERRTARGGRDSVDHAPRGHDDLANAVLGAAWLAAGKYGVPQIQQATAVGV